MTKYLEDAGPTSNRKQAFAVIFWALLKSMEFALNH